MVILSLLFFLSSTHIQMLWENGNKGERRSASSEASVTWVLVILILVMASVVPLMNGHHFCFHTYVTSKSYSCWLQKQSWCRKKKTGLRWSFLLMKSLAASFQRIWVPWLVALGNTPEAPSQTAPLTTVNLKGSEALVSPVGGLMINTTLHVFAHHSPAGKTQV